MSSLLADVTLQLGDDVQAIQCSGRNLPKEMEALQRSFEEKGDWKRRLNALKRLQGLLLGSGEVFRPALLKPCREVLLNQVQDLRSSLVREACATLQLMACNFRTDLEFFVLPALPVLLKSTSVTILIIAESCNQCASAMVRACRTARVLQVLLDLCRVKNGAQRHRAMQLLLVALENYNRATLERHIFSIEKVIKDSLEDSQAPVRTAARNCFWAFEGKFQEHGQRFLACLDPPRQRQLRLLATLEAEPAPTLPAPVLLGKSSPVMEDVKPQKGSSPGAAVPRHRFSAWSQELRLPEPTEPTPQGSSSSRSRSTNEGSAEPDATQMSSESPLESSGQQETDLYSRGQADADREEAFDSGSEEHAPWEPGISVQQVESESLERQRELLRAMGAVLDRDEETLKLLEALAERRLPALEGAVLTDVLQDLLRACGGPRATVAVGIQKASLRTLRALYCANGDHFRAAAGDLHPLHFNALTAWLPELSPAQAPAEASQPRVPRPQSWEKGGQRALVLALKGLTSSNRQAREAALEALQELLQHPECCEDFAEVLASKLFQCAAQPAPAAPSAETQRKALRLLERLLAAILPLRAMEILLPLVADAPKLALALLPLSLRRLPSRQALDHLALILPSLGSALSSDIAETRMSAIMCLVELYLSVGEEALEIFAKELEPSQLKLVVMYAARQRSPSGSPQVNSDHEHLKRD